MKTLPPCDHDECGVTECHLEEDYWQKNNIVKPLQRVVCAANRHKETKRIICGARHWDNIMRSQKLESEDFCNWEQGFLTQLQEWVSRKEAYKIAEARGQILYPDHGCGDKATLFSEMLY